MERYRKHGTLIYRTDLEGAVFIATDGTDLEIRPFLPAR
jgi:beta-lactamase superfamily II metal-dependent hydrolase